MAVSTLTLLLNVLGQFFWTLVLFTYTDFKTIVIPVTIFASVAAPVRFTGRLFYAIFWTWLHLLQVDVSNQYKSIAEDRVNRPWRPLPGGRISPKSAAIMRWLLVPICILSSVPFGGEVVFSSLSLTALLVAHDEIGLGGHWAGKNIINSFGYLSFELGATQIMNANPQLDHIAVQSLVFNGLVILTTIHSQDFSDVDGDLALGRVTIPIYAPNLSRVFTPFALVAWSIFLGRLWNLGPASHCLLCGVGGAVGWRFFRFRASNDDANTFVAYTVWLLLTHILPAHVRWGVLSF
ncbi:UbiA prenyltransferase family [Mycena maculata]|uniref:UbiA prenyltransferase family n=1 Tax=Mycena maculata TaxID=230809 RepID=A0AAD7HX42_9AGAR|nr:UbiA prenyltransferase family [Mycena maculata]